MKILEKAMEDLEERDLQELVDEKVPEGITIDYKECLPEWRDQDKKEKLPTNSRLDCSTYYSGFLTVSIVFVE